MLINTVCEPRSCDVGKISVSAVSVLSCIKFALARYLVLFCTQTWQKSSFIDIFQYDLYSITLRRLAFFGPRCSSDCARTSSSLVLSSLPVMRARCTQCFLANEKKNTKTTVQSGRQPHRTRDVTKNSVKSNATSHCQALHSSVDRTKFMHKLCCVDFTWPRP